jgi:hypothetical protein
MLIHHPFQPVQIVESIPPGFAHGAQQRLPWILPHQPQQLPQGSKSSKKSTSAARKKGKWIGGHPVLGYDIDPKATRLTRLRSFSPTRIVIVLLEPANLLGAAQSIASVGAKPSNGRSLG